MDAGEEISTECATNDGKWTRESFPRCVGKLNRNSLSAFQRKLVIAKKQFFAVLCFFFITKARRLTTNDLIVLNKECYLNFHRLVMDKKNC